MRELKRTSSAKDGWVRGEVWESTPHTHPFHTSAHVSVTSCRTHLIIHPSHSRWHKSRWEKIHLSRSHTRHCKMSVIPRYIVLVDLCVFVPVHVYVHAHAHVHVHAHAHAHVYVHAIVHVRVCVYVHVRVCVYVQVCTSAKRRKTESHLIAGSFLSFPEDCWS